MQRRRDFIRAGLTSAGMLALGPSFWQQALAKPVRNGDSPYGPLGEPDANGLKLPEGFKSRVIAQGGVPVEGTDHVWHIWSDGAATFKTDDDGWILVSNSENLAPGAGGAGAIRFSKDGEIEDAYSILQGTTANCAGGATPWGTWLSCEEIDDGRVWECDPTGEEEAEVRPALGVFKHEAVAVDHKRGHLYLTEDLEDGGLYRFKPKKDEDLDEGKLEIARVHKDGHVEWNEIPDPSTEDEGPTRHQVKYTEFKRGEGIWFDSGIVYVATTADNRIHAYDTDKEVIDTVYDGEKLDKQRITNPDNITVSRAGELFVCDNSSDDSPFDICILVPGRSIARFLRVTGPQHGHPGSDSVGSEPTGVVFDPSGKRMYFASQRAFVTGVIYEVKGPFNRRR